MMELWKNLVAGLTVLFTASAAFAGSGLWNPVLNMDAPQKHVTVVFDSVHGCSPTNPQKGAWYRVDSSAGAPCYGPNFADEYLLVRITDEGLNYIADILRGILTDETILAFADSLVKLFTDQDTMPITITQVNSTTPNGHPLAGWLCREGQSPAGATIEACVDKQICVDANDDPTIYRTANGAGTAGWGGDGVYFQYICGFDPWMPPGATTVAADIGKGIFNTCLTIPLVGPVCLNMAVIDVNDIPGVSAWHPDVNDTAAPITSRVIYWNPADVTVNLYGDMGTKCDQYKIDRDGDGFVDTNLACDNWPHSHDDSLQFQVVISNPVIDVLLDWRPRATTFGGVVTDYCSETTSNPNIDDDCGPGEIGPIPVSYYNAATDASNYLRAVLAVRLNQLALELGLRVVAEYNDMSNELTRHVRSIGIDLQNLRLDTSAYVDFYTDFVTSGDPSYDITTKIDHILPYIEADIVAVAVDAFTAPITYYFGPNPLLDLGNFLGSLTFQHPLNDNPPTWITLDVGIQSFQENIINRSTGEVLYDYDFFADPYGILMPWQFGIDIIHVDSNGAPVTGYVNRNTNYYFFAGISGVMCPVATYEYGPIIANLTHIPTADEITDPTMAQPFPTPLSWNKTPAGWQGGKYYKPVTYHMGIAIHMNPLSRVLYDAARSGVLCLWIDNNTPLVGSLIGSVLTTSTFAFLIPELEDAYPGAPMALEVRPWFYDPRAEDQALGPQGGPWPATPAKILDTPRIYTGGRISIDQLWGVDRGTGNFVGSPTSPALHRWAMTTPAADITVDIPHLELGFWVWSDTDARWERVFSLDLGTRVGVDINVFPCPVSTNPNPYGNPPQYTNADQFIWNWNNPDQLICYPNPYTVDAPNPHDVLMFTYSDGTVYNYTTAIVLDLRVFVDPNVNWFIRYAQAFKKAVGYNPADNSNPTPTELQKLENILGNLLPVLLDGMIEINASLAVDIGYLLQAPFGIMIPYFGPRTDMSLFPYQLTAGAQYRGEDLTCTNAAGYCDNYLSRVTHNAPGADAWGDYLEIYVSLIGTLGFEDLIDLLGNLTGFDIASIFAGGGGGGLGGLLGGGGGGGGGLGGLFGGAPAVKPVPVAAAGYVPANLPPETFVEAPAHARGDEVVLKLSAIDDTTPADRMRYSYSVDGGYWTIWAYNPSGELHLKGLLEGTHVIGVQALDENDLMDPTPTYVKIRVDSIGPKLMLLNAPERVEGSSVVFAVYAKDYQAPDSLVKIAYRLDSGEWSDYSSSRYIALSGLDEGMHVIRVKAVDDVGNETEIVHRFIVEKGAESAFGCAAVQKKGSSDATLALLLIMVAGAYALIRRRSV